MTEFFNKERQQFLAPDPSLILRLLCFLLLKQEVINKRQRLQMLCRMPG